MELKFEWDPAKAEANLRDHHVSFDEAKTVFADERGLFEDDPDDSVGEQRFILIGLSAALRLLVVCHCERVGGHVIRLISARKAVKREQAEYWKRVRR